MENKISVEYPRNLPDILQISRKAFEEEAKMAMAVELFEMKRLSSGMAAKLVGFSRVDFLLGFEIVTNNVDDFKKLDLKIKTIKIKR